MVVDRFPKSVGTAFQSIIYCLDKMFNNKSLCEDIYRCMGIKGRDLRWGTASYAGGYSSMGAPISFQLIGDRFYFSVYASSKDHPDIETYISLKEGDNTFHYKDLYNNRDMVYRVPLTYHRDLIKYWQVAYHELQLQDSDEFNICYSPNTRERWAYCFIGNYRHQFLDVTFSYSSMTNLYYRMKFASLPSTF